MVSRQTLLDFHKHFKKKQEVTVTIIMKKMKVSRPTATNIISTLLIQNNNRKDKTKLIPLARPGSKQKWYEISKSCKPKPK